MYGIHGRDQAAYAGGLHDKLRQPVTCAAAARHGTGQALWPVRHSPTTGSCPALLNQSCTVWTVRHMVRFVRFMPKAVFFASISFSCTLIHHAIWLQQPSQSLTLWTVSGNEHKTSQRAAMSPVAWLQQLSHSLPLCCTLSGNEHNTTITPPIPPVLLLPCNLSLQQQ